MADPTEQPEECGCSASARMNGEGCDKCDPDRALELAKQVVADLQATVISLANDVAYWKQSYRGLQLRTQFLLDRHDMPVERVDAFRKMEDLQRDNEALRKRLIESQ